MKKLIAIALACTVALSVSACGTDPTNDVPQGGGTTETPAITNNTEAPAEREKLSFWYLWGGDEGAIVEKVISSYNESQDKYFVEGLSTPDEQKIIVAISSGTGPDVTDNFGNNIIKYAQQNVAISLDDYIAAENFDTSVFVETAFQQQMYNGKTYGLPLSINVYSLYYNEDLLKESGYSEPPKTLEELKSMALEATKVENDVITQFGGMLFPGNYWTFAWALANGSTFGTPDGSQLTPDNPGMLDALEYVGAMAEKTGSNALSNLYTSGNSNYGTPQDPFISGQQLFRVDGPWYYGIVKSNNPDFTYKIAPFPGSEATGGDGYSLIETSNMFIPSTARNKDGAWDFIKYITAGEGSRIMVTEKGDLAPTKAMLNDSSIISAHEHFDVYFDIINKNNLVSAPMFERTADYMLSLNTAVESVVLGNDVDTAVKELRDTANTLK